MLFSLRLSDRYGESRVLQVFAFLSSLHMFPVQMFASKHKPTRHRIENICKYGQKCRRIEQMIYNRYVRLYYYELW